MRNLCISLFVVALTVGIGAGSAFADDGPSGVVPPRHLAPSGTTGLDQTHQLIYHSGGSVMHSNTTYAIFWFPPGSTYSSNYVSTINTYLSDVAADSGKKTNVYSTDPQYTDGSGSAAYNSTFGGYYVDTSAYPSPNHCTDSVTSQCVTDTDIRTEIDNVLANDETSWQRGLGSIFFVFTPSNVGSSVTDSSGTSYAFRQYCGYHWNYTSSGVETLYANMPYATFASGCRTGQSPNGDDADATINTLSHEHNETITDPLGNAWYDTNGDEDGDKCAWLTTPVLGGSAGAEYNQVINSHDYHVQMEWSNSDSACVTDMAAPANTALPSVSGTSQTGLTLTASSGTWTASNLTPTYAYQWRRCNSGGTSCADITGATASTYVLATADVGSTIRVGVSATTAHGTTGPAYSSQTAAAVSQMTAPANTAAPSVSGTAQVGAALTASAGTWTSNSTPTYAYQWQRCSPSCADIGGATSSTYTLASADLGSTVRVGVTATNGGGATGPVYSSQTATVSQMAAPVNTAAPSVSGTAEVGSSLTAELGTWTSNATPTYAYQWQRCSASCADIGGATSSSYTPASGDAGSTLRVGITATNAAGSSGPVYSAQTAAVATITQATTGTSSSSSSSGGSSGGGGGGGGGGSSAFSVGLAPASQSVASGGTASWTVSITNTGGAYLYALTVNDAAAPGCAPPSSAAETLSFIPPGVTVSYQCSLSGVAASFTNSMTVTATTGAAQTITQTATGDVSVSGAAQRSTMSSSTSSSTQTSTASTNSTTAATVTVSAPSTVLLDTAKPKLAVSLHLSKAATLTLTLTDAKGHVVARWAEAVAKGARKLELALPKSARKAGTDTLHVAWRGSKTVKTARVVLRR